MTQKAIEQIQEETKQIPTITITDNHSLTEATSVLSKLNNLSKTLTQEKEKLTKPLNQTLKEIRNRYRPLETSLQARILAIRSEMTRYAQYQAQQQKAQVQAIQSPEDLELAITNSEDTAQSIKTDDGSLSFRDKPTLKITNLSKIPRKYFTLNETTLLADLKSGKKITGATIELVKVPYNRVR